MILFLSDVHLGRNDASTDREIERDLIAFLHAHAGVVEHLFVLGDLFDYYIEYRTVVPKGYTRLLGLLAAWTDGGIPITYVVGNHDPWHVRYFGDELGVRVLPRSVRENLFGRSVYMAHGDLVARRGFLRSGMERLLRHPVPVWIYKNLLPADVGIFLARTSSRALGMGAAPVKPAVVASLRAFARAELDSGRADVVMLAHTHQAELIRWPEGTYINTGCWYRDRTFARMTEEGVEICRWDGKKAVSFETEAPALQA